MPKMICSNNDDNEVASKDECEEAKETMKKGPWTAAEDAMLREYVMKYGEGNWNSVQKNSGLARCGKSCRLRWANHLRPNLKKGAFSKEEEQIIIHLHAKLGNKWARMARSINHSGFGSEHRLSRQDDLPGRTDNEIKNFWNTRKKRCQRAGLPLYPPEVQNEANTYHLQQKQYLAQPQPSSSVSFSPFLSPSYRQELNELSNSSAANPQQNQPNSSCYTNSFPQFKFPNEKNGNSNMGSPYRSSSSSLFNHNFAANDSHDYHFGSYNYGFDNSDVMAGSSYESLPLVQGSNTEVSSQSSPHGSMTSALSYASGVYGLAGASSMANGYYEVAPLSPQGNSGLSTTATKLSYKRKSMAAEEYVEEEDIVLVESSAMKNSANTTNKTQRVDSNSSQFSTGNKLIAEDTLAGMNCLDDDLFSLLNNFPSEIPVLDWYHKGERQPLGLETQQDASVGPTDQEFAWTLGTFWSNMPNMC